MSNRAQRRAAQKQQPKWQKMTKEQRINALMKNGITPKDLEREYESGRLAGIDGTYKICFAAACLALQELHGFGRKRCYDVMEAMQRYVIGTLCSAETIDQVYRQMGLTLDFGDMTNWIGMEDD